MPEPNLANGKTVLLLAGESRESWRRTLEDAGFGVRTPGWLGAVTAARIERPDLVLVSMDLPANAPQVPTTAFRSSSDLADIPLAIAGISDELADELPYEPVHADRYIFAPVTSESLAREVREAIRLGRVPLRRTRTQTVAIAAAALGLLAMFARTGWDLLSRISPWIGQMSPAAATAFLALGLAMMVAAVAVALSAKRLTLRQRRSATAWVGVLLFGAGNVLGTEHAILAIAGASLACIAWIEWARLGFRARPPPTPATRRLYKLVIVLFVAAGAAPWVALGILRIG